MSDETDNLPGPLKAFAEWNPVSSVVQATREAFGNTDPDVPPPDAWPLENPWLYSLIWIVIILAIFVPLSARQYQRTTERS